MLYKKIIHFLIFKIRDFLYLIWANFFPHYVKPNLSISIDIVIPIIEKDLLILPLCLEGLKNNVVHEINDIYIVAPNNDSIKAFAKANNLIFIDENTVLGYSPEEINYTTTDGLNRSGWIFQQLLKLSGRVGTSRYFLVIDADHILLQPHVFISENNLLVFYQASWWHLPYYKNIYKLINIFPTSLFSYISHKMIFDREELRALHLLIEQTGKNKLSWDKTILSSLDISESSAFSEFELYGNYIQRRKKTFLPWRQKELTKDLLTNYEDLKLIYSKYLSVTFSSYLNQKVNPKKFNIFKKW